MEVYVCAKDLECQSWVWLLEDCLAKSSKQVAVAADTLVAPSRRLVTRFINRTDSHTDLFADKDDEQGQTNAIKHTIFTGESPVCVPPRQLPKYYQEEAKQQLQQMLQRKVIEPSNCPWSSPVVLV
uniref:Uncharacterized protein n=1 Tax=Amphimedon queenslandica TaxID=400682 RepID=A0A1X7V7U5_AMPQE